MAGNLFLSGVFGSGISNMGVVARQATIIGNLFSGALLRIYDGTQATNADTAVGAQVKLAELTFHASTPLIWSHTITGTTPSIVGTASGGNAITSDSSADATGTATWFRIVDSGATKTILDGNVSTAGANLNLNSTSITSGATVSVTSFTFTIPAYNAT